MTKTIVVGYPSADKNLEVLIDKETTAEDVINVLGLGDGALVRLNSTDTGVEPEIIKGSDNLYYTLKENELVNFYST